MLILKSRGKRQREKNDYEVKISDETKKNSNLFFSYIRSKKTVRDNIGPLLGNDNKLISDDKGTGSILNQTFSNVFTKQNSTVPDSLKIFQGYNEEILTIAEIQKMRCVNIYKKRSK